MYRIFGLLALTYTAECASYQRYGESTMYPAGYNTYSTMSTNPMYPNQYQQGGNYGNDLSSFPSGTRYPNYNPGSSTGYNSYTSIRPVNSYGSNGYQNSYQNAYSTQRYGSIGLGGVGSSYSGRSYSPYEMPFMRDSGYCVNRSPQMGIWVDSLMGMWYGVEYVEHLAGISRVDLSRTCIVIHISEPMDAPSTENQLFHVQHINAKFRQEYRHLRLLWDEAGSTNEYSLYFRNDSAGYWQVYGGQNGTIPSRPSYQQFSGTVQVLKAVSDHLLLNFCQEAKNGMPAQLYSVLFSREPGMISRWERDSVHSLLQNKKLSVASRRMVCGNGTERKVFSFLLSFVLFAVSYAVTSS